MHLPWFIPFALTKQLLVELEVIQLLLERVCRIQGLVFGLSFWILLSSLLNEMKPIERGWHAWDSVPVFTSVYLSPFLLFQWIFLYCRCMHACTHTHTHTHTRTCTTEHRCPKKNPPVVISGSIHLVRKQNEKSKDSSNYTVLCVKFYLLKCFYHQRTLNLFSTVDAKQNWLALSTVNLERQRDLYCSF